MLKRICYPTLIIFLLCLCTNLMGEESNKDYFPVTPGSSWVYIDQDGNEMTLRTIEGEEIADKIYHGFSYEPEIKDWKNFNRFMLPSLYHIGDDWGKSLVGDEVEKAVKARFTREMVLLSKLAKNAIESEFPDEINASVQVKYDVKVEAEDHFNLLSIPAAPDEEWDAMQIKATIKLKYDIKGIPDIPNSEAMPEIILNFTINETGKIIGKENVKTAAGTFEDCLKIEYRTETEMDTEYPAPSEESPGESITTLWLAPNVGIVKFHQKSSMIFLSMMSERDLVQASPSEEEQAEITKPKVRTFELKKYENKNSDKVSDGIKSENETKTENEQPEKEETVKGAEKSHNYYPNTLDSFWIYEDQDGNELTRRAIEGEEIAGEMYHAFEYEPEIKDFSKFIALMHPSLYNISDEGIKFVVSEEVKKTIKARLKNEMDYFIEKYAESELGNEKFDFDIEVQTKDNLHFLPDTTVINEAWEANKVEAEIKLAVRYENQRTPQEEVSFNFSIIESGIVVGKETVIVSAGTFQECLKIMYKSETSFSMTPDESSSDEIDPPGETVTTLWFAENVGIVKFHQKRKHTFLEIIPDDADFPMPPDPKDITFELKKYEIKTTELVIDEKELND